jgi:ATP-dependent Lhr-like helicase
MTAGEVLWQGHGSLPGDDGWVSLHLADAAHLTLAEPEPVEEGPGTPLLELLERVPGGAYQFRALSDAVGSTDDPSLTAALWQLVWDGRVTADTFAPVRALLGGGRTAHRARRSPTRSSRWSRSSVSLSQRSARPALPLRSGPPTAVGRWSLLPPVEPDPTVRALATAEQLLDRYGVLTRGSVVAEGIAGGYAGVYRVLAGAEEAGRVRRGYVVEGLGAAQFGSAGAIDRLRALDGQARDQDTHDPEVVLLAATDPANPYGASVPWPERGQPDDGGPDGARDTDAGGTHRPGRKAGSMVALVDGALALYLERGGRTALTFPVPEQLDAAQVWSTVAQTLAGAVRAGTLAGLTISKIDGAGALGTSSPLAVALVESGFHTAPQGLRLRR